jgi:hypothetical protein
MALAAASSHARNELRLAPQGKEATRDVGCVLCMTDSSLIVAALF